MRSKFGRSLFGLLSLAVFAVAVEAAPPRPLPASGPRFNAPGNLTWDQFKGKVVVVDFFNQH